MNLDFDDALDKQHLLGMLVDRCSDTRFWDGMNIDYPAGVGTFRASTAKALVDAAARRLNDLEQPNLSLASSRQILDELRARWEVDPIARD